MADTLELEATLDLQATGRLAARLAALPPAARDTLLLDGSAVIHLGGLAAQLLLSARLSAAPGSAGLRLSDPSAELVTGLKRLGIPPELFAG